MSVVLGWETARHILAPIARHALFLSLLFSLILLFFYPLLSGERSLQWDTRIFGFPYLLFGSEGLANGHFPLWNSQNFSGYPFFGDLENLMFYPGSWIFFKIFPSFGFEDIPYWFLGHFFWGGMGAYFLAHTLTKKYFPAFVGAILFALSGYAIGHLSHLGQVTLYMWIPWIFLSLWIAIKYEKILLFMLAGIVLGISFLVGHINTMVSIAFSVLLFSFFVIFSPFFTNGNLQTAWKTSLKRILGLALSALFAGGVSLLLLLPALELATQSDRTELTSEQSSQMSLDPKDVLQMVFPNLKGVLEEDEILRTYSGSVDITQSYLYIGLFPLFFCFIGLFSAYPLARFFTIIGTLFLLLSFGKYTPIHLYFFEHIPGFDKTRMAAQFLAFFFFAISMLSAFGMAQIESSLKGRMVRLLFGVFTSVAIIANIFFFSYGKDFYSEKVPPTGLFHIPHEEKLIQALTQEMKEVGSFRIADEIGVFTPNKWMIAGIENIGGNGGIKTKTYSELFQKTRPFLFQAFIPALLEFLIVHYLFTDQQIPESFAQKVNIAGYDAYKLQSPLPRAFLVSSFLVSQNKKDSLEIIKNKDFSFLDTVLLEENPSFPASFCGIHSSNCNENEKRISIGNFVFSEIQTPEYLRFRVGSAGENIFVLSETWYPGWKAFIDGTETKILRADYSFRGIPVSTGVHEIVLKFEPQSFVWGWKIFYGTLLLFFVITIGQVVFKVFLNFGILKQERKRNIEKNISYSH